MLSSSTVYSFPANIYIVLAPLEIKSKYFHQIPVPTPGFFFFFSNLFQYPVFIIIGSSPKINCVFEVLSTLKKKQIDWRNRSPTLLCSCCVSHQCTKASMVITADMIAQPSLPAGNIQGAGAFLHLKDNVWFENFEYEGKKENLINQRKQIFFSTKRTANKISAGQDPFSLGRRRYISDTKRHKN